jgi:hypothetical protein
MLYMYAVATDLGDISDLNGTQDEPLLRVPTAGVEVVAGEVANQPPLDQVSLRKQDAVVRVLHERARALLPMRFGSAARTREDVVRVVSEYHRLGERLAAVAGCEQMIVRVIGAAASTGDRTPPVGKPTTGAEYLEARAKQHRPSPDLERIAAGASLVQRGVRIEPSNQPGMIGSIYHLVERGRAEEYRQAIERTAAALPGIRVIVSGPLPAYAFA